MSNTKHLTIMFTDIKGFTDRTSKSSREQLSKLIDLHDEIIRPVIKKYEGTVVKTIGDSFMATFESPTDAVLCGIAIQDKLDNYNKEQKEKIEVRVAINSGEVYLKDEDIYGEAVNIAARIEGIAEAGQIYFTDAVYYSMNKTEIPFIKIGDKKLKGIPREVTVYRVRRKPKSFVDSIKLFMGRRVQGVKSVFSWIWRKKFFILAFFILFIIIVSSSNKKNEETNQQKLGEFKNLEIEIQEAIKSENPFMANKAISNLEQFGISRSAENTTFALTYALLYVTAERYPEAFDTLTSILSMNPDKDTMQKVIYIAKAAQDNLDEQDQRYQQAAYIIKKSMDIMYNKGMIQEPKDISVKAA